MTSQRPRKQPKAIGPINPLSSVQRPNAPSEPRGAPAVTLTRAPRRLQTELGGHGLGPGSARAEFTNSSAVRLLSLILGADCHCLHNALPSSSVTRRPPPTTCTM